MAIDPKKIKPGHHIVVRFQVVGTCGDHVSVQLASGKTCLIEVGKDQVIAHDATRIVPTEPDHADYVLLDRNCFSFDLYSGMWTDACGFKYTWEELIDDEEEVVILKRSHTVKGLA